MRNVVALGLAFLSVGVYARASAAIGLTDAQNGSAYCELSGVGGVRQGPAGDGSGR